MRSVSMLLLIMIVLTCAASRHSQSLETVPPATLITLDRLLHFTSAGGEDIALEPGTYRVEAVSQTQLGLVSGGGRETLVIQAAPTSHEVPITNTTGLLVPPDSGDEAFHIVLLVPGGTGLDAAGSPTEVRARGFSALADQARIGAAMQGPSSAVAPPSTPITPPLSTDPRNPSSPVEPKRIDCNTDPCKDDFRTALATPNSLILLGNNVDMDLSNYLPLTVAQGVTVIGTRSVTNPGSRLRSTKPTTRIPVLQVQHSNNVRLLNFRLQGPHYNMMEGSENLEVGVGIDSSSGTEIAGMELSGWSGAAISIKDGSQRLNYSNPNALWIHDNFIHHNQHDAGFGYGIVLGNGAYALIERNLFDFNRHAITGTGEVSTGFFAHRNLILKGGGTGGCKGPICYPTHQFDMHGVNSCGIGGDQNCGTAGEYMEITYNAFQYRRDNAFKLRGTPMTKPREPRPCTRGGGAFVGYNVFAHSNENDAVEQTESGLVKCSNRWDIDTFGQYGICDFDGDGRDDLFLATGVTWWYSHSAKEPWVYLNSASELLPQLGLGYFDNDRKCDVLTVHGSNWVLSKSGTSPWQTLGSYGVPITELRFKDFNRDGVTDAFRRAPDGRWSVMYSPGLPGTHAWTPLASSGFPLSQLQFGDFNGDSITDILSTSGDQWSVSWGGSQPWQRLNKKLTGDLKRLLIADVNGNGVDDILMYVGIGSTDTGQSGYWLVSLEGRSDWKQVPVFTTGESLGFVGRFDTAPGADLLVVGRGSRLSHLSSAGRTAFVQHSRFAY